MSKKTVYWVTDSYSVPSCHLNDRGKNFKESYLGHVSYDGKECWINIPGTEPQGPYENVGLAQRALMKAVNGEPVNE